MEGVFLVLDHIVFLMPKLLIAAGAETMFIGAGPRVWVMAAGFLHLSFSEPLRAGPLDVPFFSTGPAGRLGPLIGVAVGGVCDQVCSVASRYVG